MENNNQNNNNIKVENINLSKKTLENLLENIRSVKKKLSTIENIILDAQKSQYSPARDIPGEIGLFDGEYLVTESGVKYEVPKNYSAKSLLVVGDQLKKYQEDGSDRFKIVNKIPRKKVKGILSKKDGRYYVLLENNKSYHLSKHAVEFRNLKQGDEVIVVIPEVDNGSDYAAIDKLAPKEKPVVKMEKREVQTIASKPVEKVKEEPKEIKEKEKVIENKSDKPATVEFSDEDLL